MAAPLAERSVAVGRLRVRDAGGDELRMRLAIARLLGTADVATGRLPPGAILVVRSLEDPLPRALDPRAASAAHTWERAARAALDGRAAGAARPATGPVALDADAVVFADRAELLATLAAHWCDGWLGAWWWRILGLDGLPALLRAFHETPHDVPAALGGLANRGSLLQFAARLPPDAAATLARAAAAAFGATPAVESALTGQQPLRAAARMAPPPAGVEPHGRVPVPPPWQQDTAALSGLDALAPEAQVLAGIALALRRRPAAVRGLAFVTRARDWRFGLGAMPAAARSAGIAPTTGAGDVAAGRGRGNKNAPQQSTARRRGASARPRTAAGSADTTTPARPPADSAARVRRADDHSPARASAASIPLPVAETPTGRTAPDPPISGAEGVDADRPVDTASDLGQELALAVDTQLGGLFHLVLVGQLLGFYGDFTTPARPGIKLDIWDFVTLVGRGLVGRRMRDPAWALLTHLAGRAAGDAPGRGFRPAPAWRVPRTRLDPFAEGGTWRYAERGGRLLLEHPAGFAVLDAAGADLEREMRRYRVARARPIEWPHAELTPLERWAGHATRYVRARLSAALGVGARHVAPLALRRPARVLVTDTRIDVLSSLADLPIEVRRAGLDRDPGFIPAAGRSLRFHFE